MNVCLLLVLALYGVNVPVDNNILPPCLQQNFGQSLPRLEAHQAWLQDMMVQNPRYQQYLLKAVSEQELNENDFLILQAIACTESEGRHYKKGDLLRGRKNSKAIGLFQIDERVHKRKALHLGYDIYTPKGNIFYAVVLYKKEGIKPWRTNEKFMELYARLL